MTDHAARILRSYVQRYLAYRDGVRHAGKHSREFAGFCHYDEVRIEDSQRDALERILCHAAGTAPFYREIVARLGCRPDDFGSIKNITELPFLTKDIIQDRIKDLISDLYLESDLTKSYTGGTSGTPTLIYRDNNCTAQRVGRQWGILEKCGYRPGDKCGLVWGAHQDLHGSKPKPYGWKARVSHLVRSKEILDCSIMDADQWMDYHHRLRRFQPRILYGYPNALCEFGRFLKASAVADIRVDKIFCTAERLSESQRCFLESVFGGEVYNLYCTREHGCIGFECELHAGLHLDVGSVFVEIVVNGRSALPGEEGDILVTDLLNYGMPFIRYKIGDRGCFAPAACRCGCKLPLLKSLDGRVSDLLYRPDGSTVAGIMLVDLCTDVPQIRNAQIIQHSLDDVEIRVETGEGYDGTIEEMVRKEACNYLGARMRIRIEPLARIERNRNSGKYQEVICHLPQAGGRAPEMRD